MLLIKQLVKTYSSEHQPITILTLPLLEVSEQQKVAIVGPSGCGKSTLLNIIAGIVRPSSGEVNVLGTDILQLRETRMDAFRSRHIGYVFQNFNLLSGFTALENVMFAMQFAKVIPQKERKARGLELLDRVGLIHRLNNKVNRLSQGEQQRVAIARALANKPPLVLADEPTASLDSDNSALVFNLLVEMCSQFNSALIVSTHDIDMANQMDYIFHLRKRSESDDVEAMSDVFA
ncbi:ABC transporter ATP-binding protein [Paenibacillus psychroresistens]|uniref:ABC transporter ATP-binding protein n=1 Tax=Paenibacillus psychroresistens TaxID=1778678 RepID=A0A6B8RGE4_9BACL|nr:ABC transporter ATP-binding protein [Paenibacillus psychroresistens]QGQ94655.1 ABC transporter ATP-binding protein [Paenibacillus psychroresistens]